MKVHPGFQTGSSVVLHRFSTDAKYEEWRMLVAADEASVPGVLENVADAESDPAVFQVETSIAAGPPSPQPRTATEIVEAKRQLVQGDSVPQLNPVGRIEPARCEADGVQLPLDPMFLAACLLVLPRATTS